MSALNDTSGLLITLKTYSLSPLAGSQTLTGRSVRFPEQSAFLRMNSVLLMVDWSASEKDLIPDQQEVRTSGGMPHLIALDYSKLSLRIALWNHLHLSCILSLYDLI